MYNENGVTLKDITSERFCIPLYQRLFAWTPKEVTKPVSYTHLTLPTIYSV